jgi:hypothetical protein
LDNGDEARAIEVTRAYYGHIDSAFMKVLEGALASRAGVQPPESASPAEKK